MDSEFSFKGAFTDVLESLVTSLAEFIPRAVTALVIIAVGIVIAKIVERALRLAFDRLRIDAALEKMGVSDTLRRVGLQGTPGRLLSRMIYFLLVILFVQSVTQAVGLHTISGAIGSFFAYLPNLVAAFAVLLLGTMAAQTAGRGITRSAGESGMEQANLLGKLVSAFILLVVGIMAVSQLRIEIEIVRQVVLVIMTSVGLALALSFGLGTREVTRNLIAGFYARKLFPIGSEIEMHGERGRLAAITSVQTLIEGPERTVAVPNKVFLDEVVKQ